MASYGRSSLSRSSRPPQEQLARNHRAAEQLEICEQVHLGEHVNPGACATPDWTTAAGREKTGTGRDSDVYCSLTHPCSPAEVWIRSQPSLLEDDDLLAGDDLARDLARGVNRPGTLTPYRRPMFAKVSDIESILGLFSARGLPQDAPLALPDRHQSLIAVSNREFYESKLFVVPSPYAAEAGMGLCFHFVGGGVFEESINKVEALTGAEAIIRHAMANPELSLGVATFSLKQRREIQDQVELLRRANPDTEEFFHAHASEPFFIKNLEDVQGDERDVILISVGYAKDRKGYMAMRFGPLGADGGERRLNVLISRAKRRCEVYASITYDDIDLERGKGVVAFKLFMRYAHTGKLGLSERTSRDMDSVFEEQVASAFQPPTGPIAAIVLRCTAKPSASLFSPQASRGAAPGVPNDLAATRAVAASSIHAAIGGLLSQCSPYQIARHCMANHAMGRPDL